MHRIIRTKDDLDDLNILLSNRKMPMTISVVYGEDRSRSQNSLMWLWATEVAAQIGDRLAADVQAEWKLEIGVPILRADDPDFRAAYDQAVRPLPYADKIEIMKHFFPVTSLMKVRQMCRFLDQVERQCLGMGLRLTQPDDDLAAYNRRYGRAA